MPNWCENKIIVSCEDLYGTGNAIPEMERLINYVDNENGISFDFNKIIPYPDEFAKMDAEKEDSGYNSGGYQWCINNWGTKWNASTPYVKYDKVNDLIIIAFGTAGSPSLPITVELSKEFPFLKFEHIYEEMGMDFSGYVIIQNGEILEGDAGAWGDFRLNDDEYYDGDDEDEDGE